MKLLLYLTALLEVTFVTANIPFPDDYKPNADRAPELPPLTNTSWYKLQEWNTRLKIKHVDGYFKQSSRRIDPETFNYRNDNFGIISQKYESDAEFDHDGEKGHLQRFWRYFELLNQRCKEDADDSCRYKIFFLQRSVHAVVDSEILKYGVGAFNCYWAERADSSGKTFAYEEDPGITASGKQEARAHSDFWDVIARDGNMPPMESYYTSPLKRSLLTTNATFSHKSLAFPFEPIVKEGLRTVLTVHPCDKRSTKAQIHKMFPTFRFEEGFTEKDELWHDNEMETIGSELARARRFIEDVFRNDDNSWISVTTHTSVIDAVLHVTGHPKFPLKSGHVLPVMVRAEIDEKSPVVPEYWRRYKPHSTCDEEPITSFQHGGCECKPTKTYPPPEPYPTDIIGPTGIKYGTGPWQFFRSGHLVRLDELN